MDWPWDSQCRQKSSSETKGDTWAAEKGVEGTISQIKQKKRPDIDRHREGNKNKKRDNETCMKNLNHGGRQGLVKAHRSSSAVCNCASEGSCMKWALSSLSSGLLSPPCSKDSELKHTGNLNILSPRDHALQKNHYSQHMCLCWNSRLSWEVKGSSVVLPSVVTSSVK